MLTLHEWLVVRAVASLVNQCLCCENVLVGAVHNAQIGGGLSELAQHLPPVNRCGANPSPPLLLRLRGLMASKSLLAPPSVFPPSCSLVGGEWRP